MNIIQNEWKCRCGKKATKLENGSSYCDKCKDNKPTIQIIIMLIMAAITIFIFALIIMRESGK
jgi:hypothetical protein